jgi:DNA invertase Pin-like site-specific DNA recombinase
VVFCILPFNILYTNALSQNAGLDAQLRDLKAAGRSMFLRSVEKIFKEQVSSVDVVNREQFAQAMDFVREGDTLVVTKLDRLARSVRHLHEIVEDLKKRGISLQILNLGIDTGTPTGKLMLTMLGGIAEFEREIMLERQKEGVAKARDAGKYMGRKPTVQLQADEIRRLNAEGKSAIEIAAELGIHRSGVYRVLDKDSDVEARLEGKLNAWRKRGKSAA